LSDLFSTDTVDRHAPLAEQLRPQTPDEVIGQQHLLGPGKPLRLAFAETVAGLGSMILAKPDEMVVGMQVSGSHMSSAHEGDTVRAVGTIIHKGRSSHVWNVDIFTSTDKLVSSQSS
jgi:uncharacterized protein (TIGR00369 family)